MPDAMMAYKCSSRKLNHPLLMVAFLTAVFSGLLGGCANQGSGRPGTNLPRIENNGFFSPYPALFVQVADNYRYTPDANHRQHVAIEFGATQIAEIEANHFVFRSTDSQDFVEISIWEGDREAFSGNTDGARGYINTSGKDTLTWDQVFSSIPAQPSLFKRNTVPAGDNRQYEVAYGILKRGNACYLVRQTSKKGGLGKEINQIVTYGHHIACDTFDRFEFGLFGTIDKTAWQDFTTKSENAFSILPTL